MRLPSSFLRPSLPTITSPLSLSSAQLTAAICQRIPPASQIVVFLIAVWGPFYTPVLFSVCIILVHIIFVGSNVRTAWGMRYAINAVEECAGTDWRAVCRSTDEFDRIKHLIILPNYKETPETLRETLSVLASHPSAHSAYRVVLACEMGEQGVSEKVMTLIEEFSTAFFEICFTLHPRDIEGEAAGKSSNVAWASREMHRRNPTYLMQQIITVMDADSCFASDFFAAAASKFVSASPHTRRSMMFVAPIFFDRNASLVASPVVMADILWCAAGLGTMYGGSRAKLPTSAYAMSNELAARIGYWDAGPEAIGEDLHMAVKAFFETSGELVVESIFSPASQCNVVGHRFPRTSVPLGLDGETREQYLTPYQYVYEFVSDVNARYAQAKRHMWGSLDSGYAMRRIALGQFGPGSDLPPRQRHASTASEDLEAGLRTVSLRLDSLDVKSSPHSLPSFSYPISAAPGFSIITSGLSTPPRSPMDMLPTPSSGVSESDYTNFSSTDDGENSDSGSASSPPSSSSASPILRAIDIKPESESTAFLERSHSLNDSAPPKFARYNFIVLMARLFEAHFNLGYLFMFLSVGPYFNPGLEPTALWKLRATGEVIRQNQELIPRVVLWATNIAAQLGTIALISTILIFYYYEQFHHATTTKRWENRPHLGQRAYQQTVRKMPFAFINYVALPFVPLFGIIPLYHAQICHLYSNRLTYQVSAKPVALPAFARSATSTSFNSPNLSKSNSAINLVAMNDSKMSSLQV